MKNKALVYFGTVLVLMAIVGISVVVYYKVQPNQQREFMYSDDIGALNIAGNIDAKIKVVPDKPAKITAFGTKTQLEKIEVNQNEPKFLGVQRPSIPAQKQLEINMFESAVTKRLNTRVRLEIQVPYLAVLHVYENAKVSVVDSCVRGIGVDIFVQQGKLDLNCVEGTQANIVDYTSGDNIKIGRLAAENIYWYGKKTDLRDIIGKNLELHYAYVTKTELQISNFETVKYCVTKDVTIRGEKFWYEQRLADGRVSALDCSNKNAFVLK